MVDRLEAWHRFRGIELVAIARGGLDLRSNPLGWDAAREGLAPRRLRVIDLADGDHEGRRLGL